MYMNIIYIYMNMCMSLCIYIMEYPLNYENYHVGCNWDHIGLECYKLPLSTMGLGMPRIHRQPEFSAS